MIWMSKEVQLELVPMVRLKHTLMVFQLQDMIL